MNGCLKLTRSHISFMKYMDVLNGCFPCENSVKYLDQNCLNLVSTFVSDRGKGRQRQAILGDHPSSFRHDGYGKFVKAEGR